MRKRVSLEEARHLLRARAIPLGSESIPAWAAVGRVLAQAVRARRPLPPFARSAVDGYAVRAQDTASAREEAPVWLTVAGEVPAGSPAPPLPPRGAYQVHTGSALPAGADAVALQEWAIPAEPGQGQAIGLSRPLAPLAHVREEGEDLGEGELALAAGHRITPDDLPLLLACTDGAPVAVCLRPRVVIVPTGAELAPWGTPSQGARVPEVVAASLAARVDAWGGEAVVRLVMADDAAALAQVLEEELRRADVVATIGGASLGVRDHTLEALLRLGAQLLFHGVALRPGTPVLAAWAREKVVLGLPGNPVAALTAFDLLGPEVLAALAGWEEAQAYLRPVTAKLDEASRKTPAREDRYLRAWAWTDEEGRWRVRPYPRQNAGRLVPLARTNAIYLHPAGSGELPAGTQVDMWLSPPQAAWAVPWTAPPP